MIYSNDRIVQYTKIMNGDKNNFLAKYFNYDLIKDLKDFTENTTVFNTFSEKYNLRYFGELIERFDERGVVQDSKDLTTLVLVASVTIYNKPSYYNTNQAEVFTEKVTSKLREKFDLISATFLLTFADDKLSEVDRNFLLENTFKAVKEDKNISFEERVFSCYSVLYSNKKTFVNESITRDDYKERIAELFFNGTMAPQELQNKEDCTTYMMLVQIIVHLNVIKSSKSFKDRSLFKFYKALLSLVKKEQKPDKIESIIKDLNNMDFSYLMYYNHRLALHADYLGINSSVTSKGHIRIINQMLSFLGKDEPCSEYILDIIDSAIHEHSYKYRKESCDTQKAVDDFFTEYKGNISRVNFDAFLSLTYINKNHGFDYKFLENENLNFLLKAENKDLLDKLATIPRKRLIQKRILKSENNEEIKYIFNTFISTKPCILNVIDLSRDALYKLLKLNILDTNLDENLEKLITDSSSLECLLEYWVDNLTAKDFIDKAKHIYNCLKDNNILNSKKFLSLNRDLEMLIFTIYEALSTYKIEKIEDDNVAGEFYKFLDMLLLHSSNNRLEYYKHLNENLSNEHYLRVLNISEYDKRIICKSMYDNVNKYIREESNNSSYESSNLRNSKNFVSSIEEIALTLEEKNEVFLEKQRLRDEKLLKEGSECCYLSDFDILISDIKNKDTLNLMKDLFLNKISDDEFFMNSKPLRAFKILKYFDKAGILKDEDILLVSKKVIETQYN